MADGDENVEVVEPSQEEVQEARDMGWVPLEEFKGDPEKFVPVKEFIESGRQVLPIVRATNKRLRGELAGMRAQVETLAGESHATAAALRALEESHDKDVKEQVEAAKARLKTELADALRDGDHATAADITSQIASLGAEPPEDKSNGEDKNTRRAPKLDPEVHQWYLDNPDFTKSPRKVALAQVIAIELRREGDTSVGSEFLDKVAAEVDKTLTGEGRRQSKVSGDDGGGGRRASSGGGVTKTYADLPAEAKKACDKMAARLVGPERAHKDIGSWRKSYVEQYYRS